MDTLHRVAHDHEQTRPIALRELPERRPDPRMNPPFVGLSQTHDHNAVMLIVAVLGKTLVRGDQRALLGLGQVPKLLIGICFFRVVGACPDGWAVQAETGRD